MAKKRLNKKIVFLGSVFLILFLLVAIGGILYLTQGPEKFIEDGDAAQKAADETSDPNTKEEKYKEAIRNYSRARARAKSDELKVEMLFKLIDVSLKTDEWRNVLGCWNRIVQIDSTNIKARYGRLKYLYIIAEGGGRRVWNEISSQASELIEVVENKNLLNDERNKWESFDIKEKRAGSQFMGPFLYFAKGRALLEIADMGGVTDIDETFEQAIESLKKVLEFEPDNVDAHWFLTQCIYKKGLLLASRGEIEAKEKASKDAMELLEKVVRTKEDEPRAHLSLLEMKFMLLEGNRFDEIENQIKEIESGYISLTKRFDSYAESFSGLANFYYLLDYYRRLGAENIDKSIEAIERAIELDKENVSYAIMASRLRHQKFSISRETSELYKALELAENALKFPDAEDIPGPRQTESLNNRVALYDFLANCYIEQILDPLEDATQQKKQQWITKAENAVHEIEQLFGSGEDPRVTKWRGMLELAKAELGQGDKNAAIRMLYTTYEHFKASGRADAQLSYTLAKCFENSAETGAAMEFLVTSINAGIDRYKPDVPLDYLELLLKQRSWTRALEQLDMLDERFGPDKRRQELRIRAYIGAGQPEKAEEELAKAEIDDVNEIRLKLSVVSTRIGQIRSTLQRQEMSGQMVMLPGTKESEPEQSPSADVLAEQLKRLYNDMIGLINKQLTTAPKSVSGAAITVVCENCIKEGKIQQARDIVNQYLEYVPDNTDILFYKLLLSEPEPNNATAQRRNEIQKQVLLNISDPLERSISLGMFYLRNNEPNNAALEFEKVLETSVSRKNDSKQLTLAEETKVKNRRYFAASQLFDIVLGKKNWQRAGQIVDMARSENMDECEGSYFAARLSFAKEEYEEALSQANNCLTQRPVFSYAYLLRGNINGALGDEHAYLADLRKAVSLNPMDGDIRRRMAFALYVRNQKLGDDISLEQVAETKNALLYAMNLNPNEWRLQSLYAEYISDESPDDALAIQQRLEQLFPSVESSMRLGDLAKRIALRETDATRKKALFALAESSFEKARSMEPQNKAVVEAQAEYYRVTGQEEKAEQLLTASQDEALLWRHYLRAGKLKQAREVLERSYKNDMKNVDVLKGLVIVLEKMGDNEAIKKYSEELLSLEDSIENHLIQAQVFLRVGLVKEAEYKLQSLREKYPDESRVTLLEAWLAMKQGKVKNALELANKTLETDPENAVAWELRGQMNLLLSDYEHAVGDFKKSKSLSPDPRVQIALARTYMQSNRAEDAITELKTAIENPQAPEQARGLLEQIYWRLGRTEDLKEFYDQTVEKFPESIIWKKRAAEFYMRTKDFQRAIELSKLAWQKSLTSGRGDSSALDLYLGVLIASERFNKVFEEAGKYVDSDFASVAYLAMAESKIRLGDKESAVKFCRKAVELAEGDEVFTSLVLQKMFNLLGPNEMFKYAQEKIQTNPQSFSANFNMYNLMNMKGDYNRAIYYIDKCIENTEPNNPNIIDYINKKVENLMLAYQKTSDKNYLKRAIIEYESLIHKTPNNIIVLNNLAYILAENNEKLEDALDYAKRVYEMWPTDPSYLDTYGYVLYKNEKFSEAAEILHAALQNYEQRMMSVSPDVYEHLAMVREKLGQRKEAVAAYKQVLETGADKLSPVVKERINSAIERLSQ